MSPRLHPLEFVKKILNIKAFREFSWYSFSQLITQIASFFGIIFVSRYLGPSNLGLYSFVQNYALLVLTVLAGLDFNFNWVIAKSQNVMVDIKKYCVQRFYITVILIFFSVLGAWIVLPSDVALLVSIIFIPLLGNSLSGFYVYAILDKRAKLVGMFSSLSSVSLFFAKVLAVYIAAPLTVFVFIAGCDIAIVSVCIAIYMLYVDKNWAAFKLAHTPHIKTIFPFIFDIKYSVLFMIAFQGLLRIDQVILAAVSNAYTMGIYSAAVKVAEVPNMIAGLIYTVSLSRIVPLLESKESLSGSKLRNILYLYVGTGSVMMIGMIVFAHLGISILYGSKFMQSVPVLQVYAFSIPGLFACYYFLSIFGALEKKKMLAVVFGSSAVINAALVYTLTPLYGLVGTAFASVIVYTGAAVYLGIKAKKIL